MIEQQKSTSFNLLDLVGFIWGMHVVVAALLCPRSLLPNSEDNDKQARFQLISTVVGTILLLINIISLVIMFTRASWIDVAKVFFIFFSWLSVVIVYITFNYMHDICDLFLILEKAAVQSRDESAMFIRNSEAAIESLNQKLMTAENTELSLSSLLQKAAPLILLFLRKERNMLHIGLETFRLFFSHARVFKNLF